MSRLTGRQLAASTDRSRAWLEVTRLRSPELADTRRAMLDLLVDRPDALDRTCRPGHFTGSALVVHPDRERVLLLLHAKLGRWLQPGGHADGDANLAHVAWREASEETGIVDLEIVTPAVDLDIHEVSHDGDTHLHFDVRYLVLAPPGARIDGNHESEAIRWAAPEQLGDYDLDDGTHRMIAAGRRLLTALADCARGAATAAEPADCPGVELQRLGSVPAP